MKLRSYMYPMLPWIGRFISIPVDNTYLLVCDKCLQTHVGERDISSILIIARGGLAHAKEISKEEYDQLKK